MKLTGILILMITLQLSAAVYSQNTKMNLQLNNATLLDLLKKIESSSDYKFFYNNDEIDLGQKVNIQASNLEVESILKEVFEDTPYSFKVMKNKLIILENTGSFTQTTSQQKKITGKVTDGEGNPLTGVTIVVKGTTQGTITDFDGKYAIDVTSANAVLTFSFIGMETQEIEVAGKTAIDIEMKESSIGLEEVVAIGYGTVKKSDLTGSVASIQGDAIANRQSTQISQALQGAISGVMVTRDNNAPGAGASIRIRGITTIGDANPLVIVDGIPVGSVNDVNPNDVENISVLKDAASSAIYGSRAAAGVILITTKRAKSGELNLTYNAEFGMEKPTRLPKFVDVTRFMQITNELRWNDAGNGANEYPTYSKDKIENYTSLHAENPDLYPDTDWMGLLLADNAPRQSHILNISAGTKSIRTKVSLAYDKTDGLYPGRSYERFTARFNNDVDLSSFLSASVDFFGSRSAIEKPNDDGVIFNTFISPPVFAATWADGRVAEGKTGANVYARTLYGGFDNSWGNQIGGKVSVDFKPFDGFTLSGVVSPTLNFTEKKKWTNSIPYYDWSDPTVFGGYISGIASPRLDQERNNSYKITSQILANYLNSFGNHNINAMAGYENYYGKGDNMGAFRDKYVLTTFPYLDLGPLEAYGNSGNASENAYRSYFGRIMYNYMNKYFVQANMRYDGSSRFHKDYRWGSFPSFSAGWVLSEENFLKDISAISFMKLRASWGSLGNERIGNYPYQATIEYGNNLFYQGTTRVAAQTAAQVKYAIDDISWETTESFDIGVDVNFFSNKLRFTGDYYKKTTKDMLLELEIPDYMGFDNPDQNTGKMNTEGWEIELGYQNKIGELTYSVAANLSDFKSVMGDLGGIEFLDAQVKFKGSEFNEWYGYKAEGIYQTAEEVTSSATINSSVKPGDLKYTDISGPDGVPDGKITPEYDRVLLGGSLPRYMYGANINLEYRNFDFQMSIQGVGKQNRRLSDTMVKPLILDWGNVPEIIDGKFWSKYNTEEQNLEAKYPRLSRKSEESNYVMSDYWLINGAYLRLKNITLGYNVPNSVTQKLRLSGLRLYASASDLFTVDNYPKGWDPEVGGGYPITASYVFGLSVKF